jgi:dihydroorotase-like cyclic amidohydrolase
MKLIKNVSLAYGKTFKIVNILFDERVQALSTGSLSSDIITEEYDFSGCIVIPGAVDMHTHIFSGESTDAEVLNKATRLAIEGGFTTLADMPYITSRPIFRNKDLQYYIDLIKHNSFCDIALWGHTDISQSPYHIDYINELWSNGLSGFIIMHPSPNSKIDDISYNEIMDLFDTIYDSEISFAYQGYDNSETSEKKGSNEIFTEQKLASIRKILRRLQDNPLHFIGVNDRESVDILNVAFRRTDLTYAFPFTGLMAIMEKFRYTGFEQGSVFSEYVKLIFDSMKNGKLYTVSTEAGPAISWKNGIMKEAYSGQDTKLLKWAVPWVFSELWKTNKVPIQSCIRMVSENPAKRLGLFPAKGCILKGSDADMVIIDPNNAVESDLENSEGTKIMLSCSVKATFLRGRLMTPITKSLKQDGNFVKRTGTTRRKTNSSCWN